MSLALAAEAPPLTIDEHGRIRVAGTRVFLEFLVGDYRRGLSAEQMAEKYDSLQLADIFGALRYYIRHQAEVDEYIAKRSAEAAALRARIEASQKLVPSREEFLSRRTFKSGEIVPASGLWGATHDSTVVALAEGDLFPVHSRDQQPSAWKYAGQQPAQGDS